jgi:hypothetical protein
VDSWWRALESDVVAGWHRLVWFTCLGFPSVIDVAPTRRFCSRADGSHRTVYAWTLGPHALRTWVGDSLRSPSTRPPVSHTWFTHLGWGRVCVVRVRGRCQCHTARFTRLGGSDCVARPRLPTHPFHALPPHHPTVLLGGVVFGWFIPDRIVEGVALRCSGRIHIVGWDEPSLAVADVDFPGCVVDDPMMPGAQVHQIM